jgi:hypothetical protein
MTRLPILSVLALIAGCSQPASHPQPRADDPANPDAPVAAAPPVAPPPDAAPTESGHDHHDHTAAPSAALYQCPMHPEATSNDPNALCPKCGMKINKKIVAETTR